MLYFSVGGGHQAQYDLTERQHLSQVVIVADPDTIYGFGVRVLTIVLTLINAPGGPAQIRIRIRISSSLFWK